MCGCSLVGQEQREQSGKMREVADDHDVARLAPQTVAHPGCRIPRLKIPCGRILGERVARPPEYFGRLTRAQRAETLAAMSRGVAERRGEFEQAITLSTGKPISYSRARHSA